MKSKIKQRGRRSVTLVNLATQESPVWRQRVVTPLTARSVRYALIEAAEGNGKRLARDLTRLDLVLTDAEADALRC